MKSLAVTLLGSALILLSASSVPAQITVYTDGDNANLPGSWSDNANWTIPGSPAIPASPASIGTGAIVQIGTQPAGGGILVDTGGGVTVASFTFNSTLGAGTTINPAGQETLQVNGAIANLSTSNQSLVIPVVAGANATYAGGTGGLSFSNLTVGTDNIQTTGTVSVSRLVFAINSNTAGGFGQIGTINGSHVAIGVGGTYVGNSGDFFQLIASNSTLTGAIVDTSSLTALSANVTAVTTLIQKGILIFQPSAAAGGGNLINAGVVLPIDNDNEFNPTTTASFDITFNGGELVTSNSTLDGLGTPFSTNRGIGINSTGGKIAAVAGTTATYNGVIASNGVSNGTLTIGDATNTGTVVFTANNLYTGQTIITVGSTLQVGNGGADGTPGEGGVVDNGTLVIDRTGTLDDHGSVISGTGSVIQEGPGSILIANAVDTYTGPTTITAGTIQVNGSLAAGSTVGVGTAGTLSGTGTINGNATLTGNGVIAFTNPGKIVGTLGVTGGNWNGTGSVTGLVTSSSGTFNIGAGANLTANGNLNVTGGTISSTDNTGTITGSVNYTSSSDSTFNGVIAGVNKTLTLNHAGTTLVLGGINTYTGPTTVTAGTLQVDGSLASGSAVSLASGTTLSGSGTVGGATTANSATVNGTGAGLTLSGLLTFNGANNTLSGIETATTGVSVAAGASVTQSGSLTGNVNLANGASTAFTGSGSVGNVTLNGGGDTLTGTGGGLTTTGITVTAGATNNTISGPVTGNVSQGAASGLAINGALAGTDTLAAGATALSGTGTISGLVTLNGGGNTMSSTGTLTTGGLTVNGSGNTISAGTVVGNTTQAAGSALAVNGVSTTLTGTDILAAGATALSGTGTVSGLVTMNGGGNTMSSTGTLHTGGLVVNNASNTISSGIVVGNASQMAGSGLAVNGTLTGTDTLASGATALSGTGTVSGLVTMNGGGNALSSSGTLHTTTISVNGNGNSFTGGIIAGATTINGGGDLTIGTGATAGTVAVLNGGTLLGTGTTGAVSLAGGGNINLQNGSIGHITVGGLNLGAIGSPSALSFDIGGGATNNLDQIISTGALTLSNVVNGTTINIGNVGGTPTLTDGTYTLISATSVTGGTLSDLHLSNSVLDGKMLTLTQVGNNIDLVVSDLTNSYSLAASTANSRIMVNGSTQVTATITNNDTVNTLNYTGLNVTATGVAGVTLSGGTLPKDGGPVATNGGTDSGTTTLTAGTTTGVVTINPVVTTATNTQGAATQGGTTSTTVTVVDNRHVTATPIDFRRVMVGQAVSATSTLSTTGDNNHFTSVTVGTAGTDAHGISATGGTNPTFNGAGVTDTRNVGGTFTTAGQVTNAQLTLTTTGEGLPGEAPVDVTITYSADPVTKRIITNGATTDLGTVHSGTAITNVASNAFTTSGLLDTTTSVTVAAGSGAADVNGISLTGGATTFNGSNLNAQDTRTLNGTLTSVTGGSVNGSFNLGVTTLENGGAGLAGEGTYGPVSVGYTAFVYTGQGVYTAAGSSSWGTPTATPTNWTANGGVPGLDPNFIATDTATFGNSIGATSATVTLDGDSPSLKAITFNNTQGGSYTIAQGTSGTLKLNNGVGTAAIIVAAAGTQAISAPVELDSNTATAVATGGVLTLSGPIGEAGGAKSLAIIGPGETILSGANTYSGGTTLASGTLTLNGAGTLGATTGALSVAGGVLDLGLTTQTVGAVSLTGASTIQNGTLTGTSYTDNAASGTVAVSAILGGANSALVKSGASTLTLSGANTYGGGTTISGGLVNVTGNGTLGSATGPLGISGGVLDLGLTTQTVGAVILTGTSAIQNGTLTGISYTNSAASGMEIVSAILAGGGLTQSGSGTLFLSGANTFGGGTAVTGGRLIVANAGALGTGSVALSGTGTLATNNVNHLLTVAGIYSQTGGTLTININAAPDAAGKNAANDLLSVGGTAAINAGTLDVNFGSFRPNKGDIYELIASNVTSANTNGITGPGFNLIVTNPQAFKIGLSTTGIPTDLSGNNLYATVTSVQFNLTGQLGGGLFTPNRAAILDYIDNNVVSGPLFTVISTALAGSNLPATAADIADQMNPEKFGNFTRSTVVNNAVFTTQFLDDYFATQRSPQGDFLAGNGQIDSSALSIAGTSMDPSLAQVSSRLLAWSPAPLAHGMLSDSTSPVLGGIDTKEIKQTPASGNGHDFNTFIAGNVVLGQTFSQADLAHSDSTTGAMQLGADYRITPHLRAGALFSYGHTDADLDNNGSKATLDSYAPGGYVSYANGGWYANGLGSYGFNNFTEDRHIGIGGFSAVAHGAPTGDQIVGNLDGGYDFHVNNWTFGPLAGVQYTHLDVDSYTEDGAGALAANLGVAKQEVDSLRSRLGGHMSYAFQTGTVVLTPHLDASWQHEFMDQSEGLNAVIISPVTAGAAPFTVRTPNPSRDSALLDAGVNAELSGQVSIFGDYLVQVGQSNYFGQSVQAGVKIGF